VNIFLLVLALVVGIALVVFVWRKSRNAEREWLEDQAEEADDTPIPGAANGGEETRE